MIPDGKVALFCSRELNSEAYGNRIAFGVGGGFTWRLTESNIFVDLFWVVREIPIPIRIHLFGDTPEGKIGCVVLEVEAPSALQLANQHVLHRERIIFEYESIIEFCEDVEQSDDDVINIAEIINI